VLKHTYLLIYLWTSMSIDILVIHGCPKKLVGTGTKHVVLETPPLPYIGTNTQNLSQ